MIGHLGSRVSALLDGQLPPAEAERAWAHVHACHSCRDLVEREGWVKTQLSGLPDRSRSGAAPAHLKDSLLGGQPAPSPFFHATAPGADPARPRRVAGVLLGGSAAGVAVLGVVALGLGAGGTPGPERRPPVTDIGSAVPSGGPVTVDVPRQVLHRSERGPSR